MDDEIELAPFVGDALEHAFHLAGLLDVERQQQARLDLLGERLHEGLGLFVEIGQRQFRAEAAQFGGAAESDGMLVG